MRLGREEKFAAILFPKSFEGLLAFKSWKCQTYRVESCFS